MRAVLLCAGFGTRLAPLTRTTAKPLLRVGDRPIVEHLARLLDATGRVDELLVVTNHCFAEQFHHWCRTATRHLRAPVVIMDDGVESVERRLGAVGDLAWACRERSLDAEPVLVAAGDNLFKADLRAFLDDHRRHRRNLVLRTREDDVERLRRTGVATVDADGRLISLVEKPHSPSSHWAIPALYALEPSALGSLPAFVAELPKADAIGHFIAWLAAREPVFTHELRGCRLDVGDLASYRRAEAWLATDGCP